MAKCDVVGSLSSRDILGMPCKIAIRWKPHQSLINIGPGTGLKTASNSSDPILHQTTWLSRNELNYTNTYKTKSKMHYCPVNYEYGSQLYACYVMVSYGPFLPIQFRCIFSQWGYRANAPVPEKIPWNIWINRPYRNPLRTATITTKIKHNKFMCIVCGSEGWIYTAFLVGPWHITNIDD